MLKEKTLNKNIGVSLNSEKKLGDKKFCNLKKIINNKEKQNQNPKNWEKKATIETKKNFKNQKINKFEKEQFSQKKESVLKIVNNNILPVSLSVKKNKEDFLENKLRNIRKTHEEKKGNQENRATKKGSSESVDNMKKKNNVRLPSEMIKHRNTIKSSVNEEESKLSIFNKNNRYSCNEKIDSYFKDFEANLENKKFSYFKAIKNEEKDELRHKITLSQEIMMEFKKECFSEYNFGDNKKNEEFTQNEDSIDVSGVFENKKKRFTQHSTLLQKIDGKIRYTQDCLKKAKSNDYNFEENNRMIDNFVSCKLTDLKINDNLNQKNKFDINEGGQKNNNYITLPNSQEIVYDPISDDNFNIYEAKEEEEKLIKNEISYKNKKINSNSNLKKKDNLKNDFLRSTQYRTKLNQKQNNEAKNINLSKKISEKNLPSYEQNEEIFENIIKEHKKSFNKKGNLKKKFGTRSDKKMQNLRANSNFNNEVKDYKKNKIFSKKSEKNFKTIHKETNLENKQKKSSDEKEEINKEKKSDMNKIDQIISNKFYWKSGENYFDKKSNNLSHFYHLMGKINFITDFQDFKNEVKKNNSKIEILNQIDSLKNKINNF